MHINTVGHTGIYAWGNRVSHWGFGFGAVVVEPRIPWIYPWGVSMIGIYCIENKINHMKYIGQSVSVPKT